MLTIPKDAQDDSKGRSSLTGQGQEAEKSGEDNEFCDGGVQINMFVDGSAESADLQANDSSTDIHGGYAVVYTRTAPGGSTDGTMTHQGWHVFPGIDIHFCEGLAIIEAIEQSNLDLWTATNDEGICSTSIRPDIGALLTLSKSIKVKIHSDSQELLTRIRREAFANVDTTLPHFQQDTAPSTPNQGPSMHSAEVLSMHSVPVLPTHSAHGLPMHSARALDIEEEKARLMTDLVERAIKASEQLQNLPGGFEVELELHWVTSHLLTGASLHMHEKADCLSGYCRSNGKDISQIDGKDTKPGRGVLASLKSPLLVSPTYRFMPSLAQQSPVAGRAPIDRCREAEQTRQVQVQVLAERELHVDMRQEIAEQRQAATENRRAAAEDRKVAAEDRKAATEDRKVAAEDKKVAVDDRNMAVEQRQVAAEDRKVATEERKAVAEERSALVRERTEALESERALSCRQERLDQLEEALTAQAVALQIQMEVYDGEMRARESRLEGLELQQLGDEE